MVKFQVILLSFARAVSLRRAVSGTLFVLARYRSEPSPSGEPSLSGTTEECFSGHSQASRLLYMKSRLSQNNRNSILTYSQASRLLQKRAISLRNNRILVLRSTVCKPSLLCEPSQILNFCTTMASSRTCRTWFLRFSTASFKFPTVINGHILLLSIKKYPIKVFRRIESKEEVEEYIHRVENTRK